LVSLTPFFLLSPEAASQEVIAPPTNFRIAAEEAPKGLGRTGRWLTYAGTPLYIVGVDMQSLVGQLPGWANHPGWDGNYGKVLEALSAAKINKVRLWANNWFGEPERLLQPFNRVNGKYDLDQWDNAYWTRLKDFVNEAQKRGIFVEYTFFSQYPETTYWEMLSNYWNGRYNRNAAFSNTDGCNAAYLEFFKTGGQTTTTGRTFEYYQKALIKKAVAEINEYGNVMFEILNEPHHTACKGDATVAAWTRAMAQYAKSLGAFVVVESHAQTPSIGDYVNYWSHYADLPYVDALAWHSYIDDPNKLSFALNPWQTENKVLMANESFAYRDTTKTDKAVREAWAWATSGGYYAFYQGDDTFALVGDTTWKEMAGITSTLYDVMTSFEFWRMSPVDATGLEADSLVSAGPASNWQVLAEISAQYLAYFWGTPTSTPASIMIPAGRFNFTWRDVRGPVLANGQILGGGVRDIPAPPRNWNDGLGVVLLVKAQK
jgi:hypothetical protein